MPTQDDELDEADGALTATLAEGTGYTIGDPASATTTVTDDDLNETPEDVDAPGATTPVTDDDLSVVSVERVQETQTEGEEIQFTLTRTGQGDLTVTVELTLQGDFFASDQPTQTTATFGPSDTEVTVSVPTQDDEVNEADGALTATLAEGAGYTIGSSASATTTVTDDDLPVVSLQQVQETRTEGEEIQFTLTRTGQGDLTVTVELTLQGDFFAADQPTQMTATFGPSDTEVTVSVPTQDDEVNEADGAVSATLAEGAGYTIGSSASATTTVTDDDLEVVTDDDLPVVSLQQVQETRTEGEEIQFTLTRTGQGDLTVTVELTLQGDFFAADQPTQMTATFGPSDTEVTVSVPTQDDEVNEADGALTATLAEGAGYTIGSSASATTTVTDDDLEVVTDDDLPVVSLQQVQETRTEGEEIQFTLTRTGQGDLTVTVELTLQGDFFAADQPTQMTATFGPSDTEVTVSVPTQDDEVNEADGALTATLAEGAGYTIGSSASATTTVTDDDLEVVTDDDLPVVSLQQVQETRPRAKRSSSP